MAHVAKYAASASGHLTAHYERQKNDAGEYVRFGNQDIDTSKSHLNYNLAPHREDGQISFIKKRVSEVKCQKRKDVNVMCSWVVTLPKTRPTRLDGLLGSWYWDRVERDFFERAYSFMAKRYGEENVISAYVHKDENQPHMHFSFVPVTPDKKRGGLKVSAKEVLTRADLQAFHHDLERHLDSFGDWHHDVLNEATKDGNKEIAELKQRTAHERTQKALLEAAEAENKAVNSKRRVEALEKQESGLKSQIEALEAHKDVLTTAEVKALKAEKNFIGGLKGVTFKEFELLKATAVKVDEMTKAKDVAERRAIKAEASVEKAYSDANDKLTAKIKEVEQDRPSMKNQMELIRLMRENDKLQRDNNVLRKIIDEIKEHVRERFPRLCEAIEKAMTPQQRPQGKQNRDMER